MVGEDVRMDEGSPARASREQVRGCFLGGAVGDALGADIEFDSLARIRTRFGPGGIDSYAGQAGGHITDDTQMTLFTAEGLLRASVRSHGNGVAHAPTMIHRSYLRWLLTQSQPDHIRVVRDHGASIDSGWLLTNAELHVARAPGATCLAALRSGQMGQVSPPINTSKGCGGVMRVAPIGLAPVAEQFALGAQAAAITHGHPSGHLSAGAFAVMIAAIVAGASRVAAVDEARARLAREPGHHETTDALAAAVQLAHDEPAPTPEIVERLGGGWVGEEALAIAVYAALVAQDFEHGIVTAVNHSGDSDSTGAIAGNLLGTFWGSSVIPDRWLSGLAERELVDAVADDFWVRFGASAPTVAHEEARLAARYPGS
jgi:ADP-ribosyl-[dinitrogen reductase] hydrolase